MKKKYILLIVVLVIVLIAALTLRSCSRGKQSEAVIQQEKTPVEVVEAVKGDIASTVLISGKLKALHEVNVVPKFPGKVSKVMVEMGDWVNKGDVLFTLDDEDALIQLKQAEAAISMAEANYRQNKEMVENAQRDLERSEKLYEEGAISLQMLEQIRASASDAAVEVLEAQLKQAQAGYDMAANQYDNTKVTSPIDGIVSYIEVDTGEMVSSAVPAAVVVDMSKVTLEGSIGENLVNKVSSSGQVDVRVHAAGNEIFKGEVKAVSPAAHQMTGLYGVKIEIDNSQSLIKPGMFAEVELVKESKEDVIQVPKAAIIAQNGDKLVYVVEDGKAVLRKVGLGIGNAYKVEITNGVNDGEEVIVKGQSFVKDGDLVEVVRGDTK